MGGSGLTSMEHPGKYTCYHIAHHEAKKKIFVWDTTRNYCTIAYAFVEETPETNKKYKKSWIS